MQHFDAIKSTIHQKYNSGYFNYSVTITFRPSSNYALVHPLKGHTAFRSKITKYCAKKSAKYYFVAEISSSGNYHIHGLLFFKGTDYDAHERVLRLFRNFLNRAFGRHTMQRIYCLDTIYTAHKSWDWKLQRPLQTSFNKIWHYLHKDQIEPPRFPFLKIFHNIP